MHRSKTHLQVDAAFPRTQQNMYVHCWQCNDKPPSKHLLRRSPCNYIPPCVCVAIVLPSHLCILLPPPPPPPLLLVLLGSEPGACDRYGGWLDRCARNASDHCLAYLSGLEMGDQCVGNACRERSRGGWEAAAGESGRKSGGWVAAVSGAACPKTNPRPLRGPP